MIAPDTPAELAQWLRQNGLDTVEGAFAYQDGKDLDKAHLGHRRRTRLEAACADGSRHVLFLKRYARQGLWQRLRGLAGGGLWVGPAAAEDRNIGWVRAAGVATMRAVASGWKGGRGYVIVTAVPGEALERQGPAFWQRVSPEGPEAGQFVLALADLAGRLHRAGLVHRDLYASHIFADGSPAGLALYLIDLARVFRPRWRSFRWRVKDLAQLRYSLPEDWARRNWDEVLQRYLAQCGRTDAARWRRAIERKAASIARRDRK